MVQNKRWVYKKIPDGLPVPGEHIVVEDSTFDLDAAPPKGGLTIKNIYFSLDPYLRPRMRPTNVESYMPALETNSTIPNFSVSKVLKSDSPKVQPGDLVACISGGEEYSAIPAEMLQAYDFYKIPTDRDPKLHLSLYLSALGMPGRTAFSSLFEIAAPKKGETIWVSTASGPVGSYVGQLAKLHGLKVIGSVGNDDKLDYTIKTLGFDGGFNYKKEKPEQAIRRLAPQGIDIYYDNVGGEHLEAALNTINDFGRIVSCGQASEYSTPMAERYPIRNSIHILNKRLKVQGFISFDKDFGPKYFQEHQTSLSKSIADGSFKVQEDVYDGLDQVSERFVDLLTGKNFGKAIIKVASEES